MVTSDNDTLKKSDYWVKLDKEIDDYVHRNCPIDFFDESKKIEDCKNQQRIAELWSKYYPFRMTQLIFFTTLAITMLVFIYNYYLSKIFYGVVIFIVIGIALLIAALIVERNFNRCQAIIRNAERRIQYESIKSKLPQETTDISVPMQKNMPSKSGNIAQIEFIKAGLDLIKIAISGFIVAMLGLGVYFVQSSKPDIYTVYGSIVVLSIALAISCRGYSKLMNQLKDLT